VFNTDYSFEIKQFIKSYEQAFMDITVYIHVDGTLGFFKGRIKKAFQQNPENFNFLFFEEDSFIHQIIQKFRAIKAIIPEKIDEISTKQDREGAIIDRKL